ncbi:MAG: type III pantothenate kinase [Candidatus Zixiibacteriota bacterium]|nr:MAG: type III pantothenate kinase [candidate division Zixibacteria bacterium]
MLIAIDIGNTTIVVGLYKNSTLKDRFHISTRLNMTSDEAGFLISGWLEKMSLSAEDVESVIVCSVVPALTNTFELTARKDLGCLPLMLSHKLKLPIKIDIPQPDQVGADRIANAVAGYTKFGGPIIIVDFGTATNFDIVNDKGAYIGGILLPGPETSMAELARKAARLFEVRIEPPDTVVGKSTAGALKSGLFYGTIGQVDYLVDKIIDETNFSETKIVATGGFSRGLDKYSRHIRLIEPDLTLEGLRIISELNQSV